MGQQVGAVGSSSRVDPWWVVRLAYLDCPSRGSHYMVFRFSISMNKTHGTNFFRKSHKAQRSYSGFIVFLSGLSPISNPALPRQNPTGKKTFLPVWSP